jgi:hypothetical protein
MNPNLNTLNSKKVLLIAAAVLLFAGAGGAGYYLLSNLAPREGGISGEAQPSSKEELLQKAKASSDAGTAAMADNDLDTAIQKLTEAKELYVKAGEPSLAGLLNDQLIAAKNDKAAADKNEEVDAPPRGAN